MKRVNDLRRRTMVLLHGLSRAAASSRTHVESRSFGGRLRAGDEGQSLVEFAVVLPLLLLLLTFMFSVSLAVVNYEQLGDATATVAQLQIEPGRGLITDPCQTVEQAIVVALPNWTVSKFTYTLTITNSSGVATTYGPYVGTASTCTAGAAVMAQNEPATVTVSYQYTWIPVYVLKLGTGNITSSQTVIVD